jgi:hypothetical protein
MNNINVNNLNVQQNNNNITIEEAGCIQVIPIYIQHIRDYIRTGFHNLFSYNIIIYQIKENNRLVRIKKKYVLCKFPIIRRFFNKQGNFFCIFNNVNGTSKTIITNTSITKLIKLQKIIKIENKTDNLYDNKVIEEISLISDNNTKLDFTKDLVNIDKNINLNLRNFLYFHQIINSDTDKIYIKYTDFTTFEQKEILEPLNNYYEKTINELI